MTRDCELRYLQNGTAIGNFGVAVNETWMKDGEKKEKTTFLDCKAWGKTAENIAQYFKKGSRFYGHGKIEIETWDDKATQQKRSKAVIVIESFQFCDSGTRQEQSAPLPPRQRPAPRPSSPVPEEVPTDIDDVPFAFEPRKFNPYRLS